MRRASNPAICLKLTSYSPASIVINVCSLFSTDSGFIAFMNSPLRNSHTFTTPPTGARFTCTSKTFRKILSRNRLPLIVSIHSASVTTPSPGETTCPGSWGIVLFGSRKNHRKNAASTNRQRHQPHRHSQIPERRCHRSKPEGVEEPISHHKYSIIRPRTPSPRARRRPTTQPVRPAAKTFPAAEAAPSRLSG